MFWIYDNSIIIVYKNEIFSEYVDICIGFHLVVKFCIYTLKKKEEFMFLQNVF